MDQTLDLLDLTFLFSFSLNSNNISAFFIQFVRAVSNAFAILNRCIIYKVNFLKGFLQFAIEKEKNCKLNLEFSQADSPIEFQLSSGYFGHPYTSSWVTINCKVDI